MTVEWKKSRWGDDYGVGLGGLVMFFVEHRKHTDGKYGYVSMVKGYGDYVATSKVAHETEDEARKFCEVILKGRIAKYT